MNYTREMQQLTINLFFNAKNEDFETNTEDSVKIEGKDYILIVFHDSLLLKTKEHQTVFFNAEGQYTYLEIALEKMKKAKKEKEQKAALLELKNELIQGDKNGKRITISGLWIAHYFLEQSHDNYHINSFKDLIEVIEDVDIEYWEEHHIADLYNHGWDWKESLLDYICDDVYHKSDLEDGFDYAISNAKDSFENDKERVLTYLKNI